MSTFKLNLFTIHSLSSAHRALKAYAVFDRWGFPPDVFNDAEPVQKPWSNKDDFVSTWTKEGREFFGSVIVQRKRPIRYSASITFLFGPNQKRDNKPPYHSVSVYGIEESACVDEENRNRLVSLADELFAELEMDYGFICLDDEYEAKNIVKNVQHPDGSVEPRHVVGMRWPYCLPGLYWVNYFGQRYLDKGFGAGLEDSNEYQVVQIEGGIRLITHSDPRYFQSSQATTKEKETRVSLGEEWFYDGKQDRDCRKLDFELKELRSPIADK